MSENNKESKMTKTKKKTQPRKLGKRRLKLRPDEILVLRNCKSDHTSRCGFVWPKSGPVAAPDWRANNLCGNGLHGLPWGVGSTLYFYNEPDSVWKVFRTSTKPGVYCHGQGELSNKCKAARGTVVYSGTREGAVRFIQQYAPPDLPINYLAQIGGDQSTQTAGAESTQKAGNGSIQKAGDESTQTAGDESTQTAGNSSTQKAGDDSTQTAGGNSTQTAGYNSTQTAGSESRQLAGNHSTQKAGYGSVQTANRTSNQIAKHSSIQKASNDSMQTADEESIQIAGYYSVQTIGDESYQKAGKGSVQISRYWKNHKWNTEIHKIDVKTANKWFYVKNGKWRACTQKEINDLEKKIERLESR